MVAKNKILLNKSFTDFVDGTAKKLGLNNEALFNIVDELDALAKENLNPTQIKTDTRIALLSQRIRSNMSADPGEAKDDFKVLFGTLAMKSLGLWGNSNIFDELSEKVYKLQNFIACCTSFKEGKLYSSHDDYYVAKDAERVTEFVLKNQIKKDPEVMSKTLFLDISNNGIVDPYGKMEDFTKESVLNRMKYIKENFNPEEKIGKFASELEKYIETKYPDKTGKEIK